MQPKKGSFLPLVHTIQYAYVLTLVYWPLRVGGYAGVFIACFFDFEDAVSYFFLFFKIFFFCLLLLLFLVFTPLSLFLFFTSMSNFFFFFFFSLAVHFCLPSRPRELGHWHAVPAPACSVAHRLLRVICTRTASWAGRMPHRCTCCC
jgi:hypothetical protein